MRTVRADQQTFVPASHERPDQPGVWKRVLATHDQMMQGRVQMINWARLPIGSAFQRHYHEDMEETFIMVAGQAMMEVEGKKVSIERGDAVVVAPREVHAMTNTGPTDVEYIVLGVSLGQGGQTVVVESPTDPSQSFNP